MTHLSDDDEARVRAIIHEVRMTSDDPYIDDMLDELERTIENAGISPDDWCPTPQTSKDDWVLTG